VTKDKVIYLTDNLMNTIELGARLRRMVIDVGNPIVVLRADKAALLEDLVEVMDIAKAAGADRFVIATVPRE
jgi:biopolymer transport protein ExbD